MSEIVGEHGGLARTVLPNGLTVVSEVVPGVRSVAIGAWVRSASIHEAPADMGVSHMLEHLEWPERVHFFNELGRVLKQGGKATIIFTGRVG